MGQKDIFKNQVPVFYLGQQGVNSVYIFSFTLRTDLWRTYGGGGGRSTKKIFAQGNIK